MNTIHENDWLSGSEAIFDSLRIKDEVNNQKKWGFLASEQNVPLKTIENILSINPKTIWAHCHIWEKCLIKTNFLTVDQNAKRFHLLSIKPTKTKRNMILLYSKRVGSIRSRYYSEIFKRLITRILQVCPKCNDLEIWSFLCNWPHHILFGQNKWKMKHNQENLSTDPEATSTIFIWKRVAQASTNVQKFMRVDPNCI